MGGGTGPSQGLHRCMIKLHWQTRTNIYALKGIQVVEKSVTVHISDHAALLIGTKNSMNVNKFREKIVTRIHLHWPVLYLLLVCIRTGQFCMLLVCFRTGQFCTSDRKVIIHWPVSQCEHFCEWISRRYKANLLTTPCGSAKWPAACLWDVWHKPGFSDNGPCIALHGEKPPQTLRMRLKQ